VRREHGGVVRGPGGAERDAVLVMGLARAPVTGHNHHSLECRVAQLQLHFLLAQALLHPRDTQAHDARYLGVAVEWVLSVAWSQYWVGDQE
jgi:hypothetical protein